MNKVGSLTVCKDEEACIVFCIASLIDYVDHYVVVDSGSTDKTLFLIKKMFAKDLKEGKLRLIEYGALPDYDISKPKNIGIAALKETGCDYFIRLDADDVFYREGAQKAVEIARNLDPSVTMFCINHWELYQYKLQNTSEWLDAIESDVSGMDTDYNGGQFMCLRIPPGGDPRPHMFPKRFEGSYGHARIYKTQGAVSIGKWTDEAWGVGPGEDIAHPGMKKVCIGNNGEEWIVHYGWARPMDKKLNKMSTWEGEGKERQDPRVDTIHEKWKFVNIPNMDKITYGNQCWPHNVVFPFNDHPEVFHEYYDRNWEPH